MKKLPSMRLLVCDTAENASEALLAALAKAGMAATAQRVSDKDELLARLARPDWDLLLLNDKVPDIELRECASCVREHKHCAAIAVLTSGPIGVEELGRCYRQGAAALVTLDAADYSVAVIGREFVNVQNRRRQIELARENAELTERCQLLLRGSRDAIAYVHDGMHVYANDSYRELYGFADMEELTGTPFIDMVGEDCKERLRLRLKEAQAGAGGAAIEVEARRADASAFNVRMEISPTLFEGEKCLQVIVGVEHAAVPVEAAAPAAPPEEAKRRPAGETASVIQLEPERRAEPEKPAKEIVERLITGRDGAITYQPVIAVSDMEPEFYAMELRLREPGGREIVPDDYLEAVSRTPHGRKLDQWALEEAVATLVRRDKLGERLQFLVNLSAQGLADRRLPESCAGLMATHGLDCQSLVFTLRQDDVMEDPEQTLAAIERLRSQDLRVCLSGFDASPEALALVREARVRLVKLKREVSLRIMKEAQFGDEFAKLVAGLHDDGVKVIAALVDDTATLSALWKAEIDLVQGILLPNLEADDAVGVPPMESAQVQGARPLTRQA